MVGVFEVYSDSDMFEMFKVGFFEYVFGNFKGNSNVFVILGNGLVDVNLRRIELSLGFYVFLFFSSMDNGVVVKFVIVVSVIEVFVNGGGLLIFVVFIERNGCVYGKVLYIMLGKIWVY